MDTKDQIAVKQDQITVMQAYLEGKTIQFRSRSLQNWKDIIGVEPTWSWDVTEYRIKPESILPTTWEEFCKTHFTTNTEVYINTDSEIESVEEDVRLPNCDANLLPNRQIAEAMLALCKLVQLRDCYNDGWQPDWSNDSAEKYTVCYYEGVSSYSRCMNVLTFKTAALRELFIENFRDLIEIAKPLL